MITRYHAKYYASLLSRHALGDGIDSLSQSLLSSTVDINPHQIDAALFAFKSPFKKGVVLADEVGLGKTIEAGLVLCQYWSVGKRKIIVVCPASLRKQWESELQEKFGIRSEILDTKNFNAYVREGKDSLEAKRVIICSYNFAARHKGEILTHCFDLAVIDEAHKLRNVYRPSARTAADVRDALYGVKKLLLTATPFQNSLMELYGLTSVIDDHIFGSEKTFRAEYGKGENLVELRQRVSPYFIRTLRKDVSEYINYTHRLPLTQKFNASDEEFELYNDVSDFLRRDDIYSVPSAQRKLTTMIIRKILASSTFALISTLTNIRSRLQGMLEANKELDFEAADIIDDIDEWESFQEDQEDTADTEEEDIFDDERIDIARLKAEIKTIDGFIEKAKSIKQESKAAALLKALRQAFKKLQEEGANRKALIFTESTKTQAFLREMLEDNGYAGKIVLFNGKASEPQTNDIYQTWCQNHPDQISGIKSADRRAAIVDYFKNDAEIMIATEAASEGLNLQFCSLVINYDLPWNPQRIEQRIGRCHRYGQKFDVVVVNFINQRNFADVRVFDLLSSKFKLFDAVFGASDEVLGRADSIDIESRIWEIYQQCRSNEEIQQAFERLQADMAEQIDERMDTIRAEVIENFDINVQEHLRIRKDDTRAFLNRYQHIFWELTKYMLSIKAVFNEEDYSFRLLIPVAGCRTGLYSMTARTQDALPYRLNDELGQYVINTALSLQTDDNSVVTFDEQAMNMNAPIPDYLRNQRGYLLLARLDVSAADSEQYNIFTAFCDDGTFLSQEDCEKLFLNGGDEDGHSAISMDIRKRLTINHEQHTKAKLHEIDSRNLTYFNEEQQRIEKWEHDMLDDLELQLRNLRKAIQATEREASQATNMEEKLKTERKVDELKRRRQRMRRDLDEREDEISEKRKAMISEIEQKLVTDIKEDIMFIIRWQTK
jgi:ERCC4-related helicase